MAPERENRRRRVAQRVNGNAGIRTDVLHVSGTFAGSVDVLVGQVGIQCGDDILPLKCVLKLRASAIHQVAATLCDRAQGHSFVGHRKVCTTTPSQTETVTIASQGRTMLLVETGREPILKLAAVPALPAGTSIHYEAEITVRRNCAAEYTVSEVAA